NTYGHPFLWVSCFLSRCANRIETDKCKENHTGTAHNPAYAVVSKIITFEKFQETQLARFNHLFTFICRNKWHMVKWVNKTPPQCDENQYNSHFNDNQY